ncbi:MAG TPA: hypothetical protein DCQ06_02040, partial [Myxococcales bacterium]|nr:hypothetical protein [Myxococcales bacterium]
MRKMTSLVCVVILALTFGTACGDSDGDGSVSGGTVDSSAPDEDISTVEDTGAEADSGQAADAGSEDTSSSTDGGSSTDGSAGDDSSSADASGDDCPGGFGCACSANSDCDSGHCIDSPNGKICTVTCVEDCPSPKFKCVTTGGGADTATICVSKRGNLCNPCNSNNECQTAGHGDARCIDQGDAGAFCGTG